MHTNTTSPASYIEQRRRTQQNAHRRAAAAAQFPVGSTVTVHKRNGKVVRHDHEKNLSVQFGNGVRKTIDPLKLLKR